MASLKNTRINDTGFLEIPAGTTAQRPGSPTAGMYRFNTDYKANEYYDGSKWIALIKGDYSVQAGTLFSSGSSSTSSVVSYPSDIQAGDLLFTLGYSDNVVFNTPSGWDNTFNSAFDPTFFKTATGSESGTLTLTHPSSAFRALGIYRIRHSSGITPQIVAKAGGYTTSGTIDISTGYVENGFDLAVTFFGIFTATLNSLSPPGYTTIYSRTSTHSAHSHWWSNLPQAISFSFSRDVNTRRLLINLEDYP